MMTPEQREKALAQMQEVNDWFYSQAIQIGNHPYIEFCGLLNEYVKACKAAHDQGIDFSECNKHSGDVLPLANFMSRYINDKLDCIFSGAKILDNSFFPAMLNIRGREQYVHSLEELPIGETFSIIETGVKDV